MKYTQVHINSVDVSDYKLYVEISSGRQELFNVNECKIRLKRTVTAVQAIDEALTVEVWGGELTATDVKKFKGTIINIKREVWGYEITCFDENYEAVKNNINKYYLSSTDPTAGNLREIVKDMLVNYAGLSADNTSVDDPGLILSEFPCRDTDVSERIKFLGGLANFVSYYDPVTDMSNWRVLRYTTNANIIYIGGASSNVVNFEKWVRTTEGWLINKLNLRGSFEYPTITELFDGDAATTEFSTTYIPETVDVYISGTQKTGGKEGFSTGYDYYIRKEDKKIVFTTPPASGTGNISITYSYKSSTPIQISDEASIAEFTVHETTITFSDVMNVADAEQIGDAYVQSHKDPIHSIVIYIAPSVFSTNGYALNDEVTVDDAFHDEMDGAYVITNVTEYWPSRPVKVTLSDKPLRTASVEENTVVRLKRLEELSVQSTDIITLLTQREHEMTLERHQLTLEYEYVNDSFILGHPVNGLLGMGVILDDFESGIGTWSANVGTTIASDAVFYLVGSKCMSSTRADTSAHVLTSTNNYGDISTYTGASSGAPTKGTVGLWIARSSPSADATVTLRIGSDSSNYTEVTGRLYYRDLDYGSESTTIRQVEDADEYFYLVFRLLEGITTGTPNWTACDYTRLSITGGGGLVLDYLTISKSNYIGLNGLGERKTVVSVFDTTY